jgi:alpha-amylase
MTALVFYFQVHQPFRIRPFSSAEVGSGKSCFDDGLNEQILRRVADRCYLPMNALLSELIESTERRFRCAFSISGTALEQMELWAPEVLESFRALADTGCVEFLCETSHHSMSSLADADEFRAQVRAQSERIETLCGRRPTAFRNTELVISESIAALVEELGFEVLLGEGADRLLNGRSPHHAYRVKGTGRLKLLLRDYVLSDDIAFRFSNKTWEGYPLLADVFARRIHRLPLESRFVGFFMDYETFGEHQWSDTGIFAFMRALPEFVLADSRFHYATPTELARRLEPVETLPIPDPVSWADAERDVSAWLGNPMQRAAHRALYDLAERVRRGAARKPGLLESWRKLTTSDHVYYMSTKRLSDQDVHEYFSPYSSPHAAFVNFMNAVDDLTLSLPGSGRGKSRKRSGDHLG